SASQEAAVVEESTVEVPADVQQAIEEAAEESLQEEQRPEEVKIDTEIKAEDLEVKEARVLPGSFFYGFKNFVRGIQEAVTRDPVRKAELQLRHANEQIIEAKQLVEKDDSDKAAEIAAGVIKGINRNFEKIANQSDKLNNARAKDGQRVEKFLDKIADQSLKQQVVLQMIQEQVPEKVFARIEQSRQDHLEKFGQVMTRAAENPEDFARRLPQIIENREGSDFKELKAVEILRDLEGKVPEDARESLRLAQNALSQRFEQRFATIPPEVRKEKLQNYVESLPGNAVRQFEAFDRMRESFQSEGMAKEMELAKDKALQKFENQFAQFEGQEARQAFMRPWQDGSPEALRTMTEMEMRLEPAEGEENKPVFQNFQQFRQGAQDNFRERFADNPEQLRENPVFQRMENRPDIVDLKMSQDLVKIFSPSEREPVQGVPPEGTPSALNFMRDFQNQATGKFIENFSGQPEKDQNIPYLFGPPIPGGLKVLEEIKNQVPFQGQQGINRAIEAQTQTIERHLEEIDDPAMFERYKQQIEGDNVIKGKVEQFGAPNFFRRIEERGRQMEVIEKEAEARKIQRVEEINQQIFSPSQSGQQPKGDVLRTIKPEMRREVEQFRKNVPSGQQPIFRPQFSPRPQEGNPGAVESGAPERSVVPLTPERQQLFEGKQLLPQNTAPSPLPIQERAPIQQLEPSSAPEIAPAPSPVPPTEPTSANPLQNFLGSLIDAFRAPKQ
ncbi:MAG: hypothetical protein HY443_01325, partial [Candidatus Nealsonbacteria bacterium]|nr:hypothetical protein [Candidatus Nealsonbacteria bacterium]